jgi:putative ABC transport system substrate-binding protein
MILVRVALLLAFLALPFASAAQPRIGVIEYGNETSASVATYLAALRELGYVEPHSLVIERRFAHARPERFTELVDELARARVNVIFTLGHDIAHVAKRVAPGMPIVTAGSEDPVLSGLVASLARPGGNVTGVTFMSPEHAPKRLELLRDAVPGLARVAVLWDPGHADTYYAEMEKAARSIRVELHSVPVREAADLELEGLSAALKASRAQALFIVPGRLTNFLGRQIATAAIAARLPAIGAYAVQAQAGSLLAYGADIPDLMRRAAAQTDRILKGAKAGDLPVEQASRFVLVLNLKTAKALGIAIPQSVLLRADEVIQ